ncbi:hypothetical protein DM02DRAFT_657853 [Periconia macrospinosa]|uniref:Uncharacterized protein n=1 Tax=Periconia macrospinosa TaxID=97972 RepID=A0A2V1DI59_9PLEO|nr:hypothetical protein DM02DRAFT_657853 [Periconia macrospinosa]
MKLSVILSLAFATMAFGAQNVQENLQRNAIQARQNPGPSSNEERARQNGGNGARPGGPERIARQR